jgi:hypothetical protein
LSSSRYCMRGKDHISNRSTNDCEQKGKNDSNIQVTNASCWSAIGRDFWWKHNLFLCLLRILICSLVWRSFFNRWNWTTTAQNNDTIEPIEFWSYHSPKYYRKYSWACRWTRDWDYLG